MSELAKAWDARIERALARAPGRIGSAVRYLRAPSRRFLRIAVAALLVLGGLLSILPVLGIWMLPLGLALLAEDAPGLKGPMERTARFVERAWRKRPWRRDAAPGPAAKPPLTPP